MRILCFKGCFDPITRVHIRYALDQAKVYGAQRVVLILDEQGVADFEFRKRMIIKSIRPFRKLSLIQNRNDQVVGCIDEREVQWASLAAQKGEMSLVNSATAMIMSRYGLYSKLLIKNKLNERRYQHSIAVAEVCCEIAKSHQLDSFKAYLMGIYHDLAKNMHPDDLDAVIQKKRPYESTYPLPVWHQYVATYLLETKYKLHDQEMLNAIRHHCLGDNQDPYAMVLFIADKIEPSRGYDVGKEMALSKRNLKAGFKLVKANSDAFREKEKHRCGVFVT